MDEVDLGEVRMAQKMSGGLLWLSCRTRPDISYATSRVSSQATTRPAWALKLGKRILRYLAFTKNHALYFNSYRGPAFLLLYADASFEPFYSQTGIVVYWRSCCVDWRSLKQAQVPRSTAESEITSLATGGLVLEGVESQLNGMHIDVEQSHLYGDNSASISLSNGSGSWGSRALTNRAHGIKTRVETGLWHLSYVPTQEQCADGFTKFLCVSNMNKFRNQLGLRALL